MQISYSYILNPNVIIDIDKFTLSDITGGVDNINWNWFVIPESVLVTITDIEFQVQSSDFGNYQQKYSYPQGTTFEDNLLPIIPYGFLFVSLPDPNSFPSGIYIGGFDEICDNLTGNVIIRILLYINDTLRYRCGIRIPPEAFKSAKGNTGYCTIKEALNILGGSMSGRTQTDYIRKSELISLNANDSKLSKYGDNDFVNTPDIVKATNSSGLILNLPLTSTYQNKDLVTNSLIPFENGSLTYSSDGAYFNGISNLSTTQTKFAFSEKRLTIAFRFKSESKSGHNGAFFFGIPGGGREIYCGCPESGQMNIYLKTYNLTNGCFLTKAMSYNTWYNVVCRYDGSYWKLRVNSSEVISASGRAFPPLSGYAAIGGRGNDKFKGTMRNFRIWNRALTDSEVSALTF